MIITVNFQNQAPLYLEIRNSEVGRRYFELVKSNYQKSKPIYRDELKYTPEYIYQLAAKARTAFGWNWDQVTDFSSGIAPYLHKDLEVLLAQGFEKIPEKYDDLIHELHYCLHLIQHKPGEKRTRNSWFQIEWYNDEGFELDPEFRFQTQLQVGDVRFQNPFVGHGPWQMWREQDFLNITQTCKFHTFVKPGINIVHTAQPGVTEVDQLIEKFKQHDPVFVQTHGVEKIRRYIGHPIIGRVINLNDLRQIKQEPILTLASLGFEQ